jgi:ADP-heptose:LPS heptosyltransferase
MSDIREKDWKIIRSMKDRVLNLACDRILAKVLRIIENEKDHAHARYLELWNILRSEDEDIAIMFNDLKRSNAIPRLAKWKFHGLITDDDMKSFSQETQEKVRALNESWR